MNSGLLGRSHSGPWLNGYHGLPDSSSGHAAILASGVICRYVNLGPGNSSILMPVRSRALSIGPSSGHTATLRGLSLLRSRILSSGRPRKLISYLTGAVLVERRRTRYLANAFWLT